MQLSGYFGNVSYGNNIVNITGKKFSEVFTETDTQYQSRDYGDEDSQYQAREYEEEYPTYGVHWGIEAGIISNKEARAVWEAVANFDKRGYYYPKAINNGHYVQSDNYLMIVGGDYNNPSVRTIFELDDHYETSMAYAKELLINAKGIESEIRKACQIIEAAYGYGYVTRYDMGDYQANGRENRGGKGRNRYGTDEEVQYQSRDYGNEDSQYQAREYLSDEAEQFQRDIDEWEEAGKPDGETFILGSTGDVLQGLGAIESDIYMLSDKINTILKGHPEMTVREIKSIPEILENPVLVLASRNVGRGNSANTRLTIFGMVKAQNKLSVMAVFELRPVENKLYLDDMQKVVSAYTKDNSPTAAMNLIRESDVLYADKDKTASLLHTVGFQNAYRIEQSSYIGNIAYGNNFVNITGKKFSEVFTETDTQYQSREYEEDEPKKYSYEWFTAKPDMAVTTVDDNVSNSRADIVLQAKQNAASVGHINKDGVPVVHVDDIDTDVLVSKKSLVHGLDRRLSTQAPVLMRIGDVLKNAIRINELLPRQESVENTYVLIGAARSKSGLYIASFVVNRYSNEVAEVNVLYSANAKKESAALLPKFTDESATPTDSVISIEELLGYVNTLFPDILPEDVLKHFGHDRRPEGTLGNDALYQQRTDTLTDREILSLAAGEINPDTLTDAERDALRIFNDRLTKLDELTQERKELGQLYREQQFGPNVDREAAKATREKMQEMDARIEKASDSVLSVEDKPILRQILQKARKVIEQEDRAHAQEILRRARDRRENAAAIKKYRTRIRADVGELSGWILHPSNKDVVKHIPDAHSAKKGNKWHFGYKAHVGVDHETGIVHSLEVTSANKHDVCMTAELLTGEEEVVYGDSGYLGAEKRPEAVTRNKSGKRIRYKINRRPSQSGHNSNRSRAQIKRRELEKLPYEPKWNISLLL